MKSSIFHIITMGFLLGFLLPTTACYRRQAIVETQRTAARPADDVYYQKPTVQTPFETSLETPPDDNVSYQVFYDELSPYGSWVDYPSYGYVWVPRVTGDFQPY